MVTWLTTWMGKPIYYTTTEYKKNTMYLFHDSTLNTWKLITEKLPEKPDFDKLKNDHVFKDYKFYMGYKDEDIQQQYNDQIAALKQNALTVGNWPIIEASNLLPKPLEKDVIYSWCGGVQFDWIKDSTKETGAQTVAILTLPEEKSTKHINMKFRKKPVVIEAFRMGIDPRPDWFTQAVTDDRITTYTDDPNQDPFTFVKTYCLISTLEGKMKGDYGDFIIQGVNGEIYPCKPEIFEKTYEPV